MRALGKYLCSGFLLSTVLAAGTFAQQALSWQDVKDRFQKSNPTLRAGQIGIDESKASEITAYLRPNPNFTLTADGVQVARHSGVWQPLSGVVETPAISYLHERQRKRELRLESARKATELRRRAIR